MDYLTYYEKIEQIKQLSKLHATGSRLELAKRLNIPGRTLDRMIDNIKCQGINIYYSRKIESYCID